MFELRFNVKENMSCLKRTVTNAIRIKRKIYLFLQISILLSNLVCREYKGRWTRSMRRRKIIVEAPEKSHLTKNKTIQICRSIYNMYMYA